MAVMETSMETEGKYQFAKLKPYCVSLMKQRDQKSLNILQKQLSSLSELSPSLIEYILFPLRITLQESVSQEKPNQKLLESSMLCVNMVLSKTIVSSEATFHELLSLFCIMLDPEVPLIDNSKLKNFSGCGLVSEEMMTSTINAINLLLLKSTVSIVTTLYNNVPAIAHCVSVIKSLLIDKGLECGQSFVVTTLHALIALSRTDSSKWIEELGGSGITNIGKGSGAHIFSSFIPSIAITLGRLATETRKGKNIIALSILGWGHYVAMVLNDGTESNTTLSNITGHELLVERTKEWFKETDGNLAKLSSKIAGLVSSKEWIVRASLCVWARTLLLCCHRSLPVAIGPVIETIISLSTDEYPWISSYAKDTIDHFKELMTSTSDGDLVSLLEDKLYSLVTELPGLVRRTDETKTIALFQLLHGYLNILGSHVHHMTSSIEYISRIIQAMSQTIELGSTQSITTINQPPTEILLSSDQTNLWVLPVSFIYLREDKSIKLVQSVCRQLGRCGHLEVILDYVVEKVLASSYMRSELLLLMHWTLQGVPQGTSVSYMLDCLFQLYEDERDLSSYTKCFLMNVLTDSAFVMGDKFRYHLQKAIIVLLEATCNDDKLVANTGATSIGLLAQYMGHSDVSALITHCADYLVHSVSLSFIHCTSLIKGCHVLEAIITCSSYSIFSLLSDCQEALLLSLDQNYEVIECWRVLHGLAKRLQEWINVEVPPPVKTDAPLHTNDDSKADDFTKGEMNIEDISEFFQQYHKKKQETEANIDDNVDENEVEDYKEKAIPPAVKSAVDIIRYSVHFLSVEEAPVRSKVLDCLELLLVALKQVDENIYLPEIHKLWSPFVHRLVDGNLPIRAKAINVLYTLSSLCGTFLRKRVIKEIWPCFIKTFEELKPIATSHSNFSHTLDHKLLSNLIAQLPHLCSELNVAVVDCEAIICWVIYYLRVASLESVCEHVLYSFANLDPDLVWLLIIQLIPQELPSSPFSTDLNQIKLPSCPTITEEQYGILLKILLKCNYSTVL